MGLRDDVPALVELIKASRPYLGHNKELLDIYEGNLTPYIVESLRQQLGPESLKKVVHRIPPINLLSRLVDKLSKIYTQPPARTVKSRKRKADGDLLQWYVDSFKMNRVMNQGNEFFNLFKNTLLQPIVVEGMPKLRAIPSDRFVVRGTNPLDKSKPTQIAVYLYSKKASDGSIECEVWQAYSDDEVIVFNTKSEIEQGVMTAAENPEGENRFGKIPLVYVNRSLNCLMPTQDTDVLAMTKLIPVLLADLSYAIMFQAFSILYGIDVDDENVKMAPSAFWRLKSDPKSEKTPQLGTIKPEVDIDEVLGFIQSVLSLWLQSKNIRPGAIGQLTADNFASGVSKMVDEMDTSEDRQKQVEFFKPAEEEELWPLIMNHMHPFWVDNGLVKNTALFTPEAKVEVNFAEQLPLVRRGELVKDLQLECEAGFLKRRDAISKLNPHWDDTQVDAYAAEVEAERAANRPDIDEGEEAEGENENVPPAKKPKAKKEAKDVDAA